MNYYVSASAVSMFLFGLGFFALAWGLRIYQEDKQSVSNRKVLFIMLCVFGWNAGYAWMGLCYDSGFAYVARAIALSNVFLYMYSILGYVAHLSHYSRKKITLFNCITAVFALISYVLIVEPSAVTFSSTPWGYWYSSSFSLGRGLQFACILTYILFYYWILHCWWKKVERQREKQIIKRFRWFAVFQLGGALVDTVFPTFLKIPAIPGSSVGAFAAAVFLYWIAKSFRAVDVTVFNISGNVFREAISPIFVLDEADNIVLFNETTKVFYNKTEEELTGAPISQIMVPAGEEEGLYYSESFNMFYKASTTAINDAYGDLLYKIVFLTDMTSEHMQMDQMATATAQADAANLAKSMFLANMSHEIRTPMNSIIGMSDLLLQDDLVQGDVREKVQDIRSAGNNLLGIINDILDISKIESGKMDLNVDTYSMTSLLYDLNVIAQNSARDKHLEYLLSVNADVPMFLQGDAKRIRQILVNLLGNAMKFTEEGHVKLTVDWNYDILAPKLQFQVEDTGLGIKPENLERIFENFSRVDAKHTSAIQGTGLGLTICRNLARMMDGDVTVTSTYGKGSVFTVTISQNVEKYEKIGTTIAEQLEEKIFRPAVEKNEATGQTYPGKKALVVDDVAMNLKVAKGLLMNYELQIDLAESGREAIRKIRQEQYDIVFMDHFMPDMDGVETTKEIRSMDNGIYKDLVIVALTANAGEEAKEMLLESGMQDYISKPIQKTALERVLTTWM